MFNQATTTSAFGSGNSAFGGNSSSGSTFGNSNNATPSLGVSFGQQNQQNQQNSTPQPSSFSFGSNNNASNASSSFGFGSQNQNAQQKPLFGGGSSSLFGQNQQSQQNQPSQAQQSNSLFGGSGNTSFGGMNGSNVQQNVGNQQTSLFSNPTLLSSPQQQVQSPQDQSLFRKSSLFSVSSSGSDANRFLQQTNAQSPLNQSQAQQNQLYPSPVANNSSSPNTPAPLRHSQSSIALSNGTGYRRANTPSWASEKRYAPSTPSNLRHVSSFSTADRGPSHRKASISPTQSPSNSFGTSFSGIPKSSHSKKKTIAQEEPPPTRSIYDATSSPSLSKPDMLSSSLSKRNSLVNGTPIKSTPSTPRPSNKLDHSHSVVVFGFPSSVTPAVVSHFSRFGTIAENLDASSRIQMMSSSPIKPQRGPPTPIQTGKNWLKITYDNPGSASRAIHENGTLIAGQYVVGCIPVTSQNAKEFEIASETSMLSGMRTPGGDSTIGDFSGFYDEPTADFSITDGNVLPSMPEDDDDEPSILKGSNGRTLPRAVSLPTLAGSKRVHLKDGRSIFNKSSQKQKQMRYSPSLFKISQEPDPVTSSGGVNNSTTKPQVGNGTKNGDDSSSNNNKRLQSGKGSWMSWSTKKAQELVFGWDDL